MQNILFSTLISPYLGERKGEEKEMDNQLPCTVTNNDV
jgi:hypothetical protein